MLKKAALFISVISFCSAMTGCASIVNGTNQPVSVQTDPVEGARCTLENNKGKWFVTNTPGSVVVHRSYSDLKVVCSKPGYRSSHQKIASNTKPMVFGNALFGGVIGAGVDVANGAAYDYPGNIIVPLSRA